MKKKKHIVEDIIRAGQAHKRWVKHTAEEILGKQRELAEQGSSPGQGRLELSPEIKVRLSNWLESGQSLREFFELNAAELGDPAEYNLIEFVETNKEWIRRIGRGRRDLPGEVAVAFEKWLEAEQPAVEFFELNAAELGDPAQYNLAQFLETDREWLSRTQKEGDQS